MEVSFGVGSMGASIVVLQPGFVCQSGIACLTLILFDL